MSEKMPGQYSFGPLVLVYVLLIIVVPRFFQPGMPLQLTLSLIAYVVVPFLFYLHRVRKQHVPLKSIIHTKGIKQWLLPIIALSSLVIALGISTLWLELLILLAVAPGVIDFLFQEPPFPESTFYLIVYFIFINLLFPIADELIFRGLLLRWMISSISFWGGILISSALYALFFTNIINGFLLALIAALLYLRTDNLLVPILFNCLNCWMFSLWVALAPPTWPEWLAITEDADVYAKALPNAIVLAVGTVITVWAVHRLLKGMGMKKQETKLVTE